MLESCSKNFSFPNSFLIRDKLGKVEENRYTSVLHLALISTKSDIAPKTKLYPLFFVVREESEENVPSEGAKTMVYLKATMAHMWLCTPIGYYPCDSWV